MSFIRVTLTREYNIKKKHILQLLHTKSKRVHFIQRYISITMRYLKMRSYALFMVVVVLGALCLARGKILNIFQSLITL